MNDIDRLTGDTSTTDYKRMYEESIQKNVMIEKQLKVLADEHSNAGQRLASLRWMKKKSQLVMRSCVPTYILLVTKVRV